MAKAQLTWLFEVPMRVGDPLIEGKQAATEEEARSQMVGWGDFTLNGKRWERTTDLGGYPLFYVTKDNGCLCPKCANENIELTLGDDPQWKIEQVDVNWENHDLYCDNCNEIINPAYGDD